MTREEWLLNAAVLINQEVFDSKIDTSSLQISIGKMPKSKLSDSVVQDTEKEDVSMNDFFPPQIFISAYIDEPLELLSAITHELIHVYLSCSPKHDKRFKNECKLIGLDKYEPDELLTGTFNNILNGFPELLPKEFPGTAAQFVEKQKDESKGKTKNETIYFCPECGFEVKTKNKIADEHPGTPTCVCGCKMGIANDEGEKQDENTNV